MPIFQKYNTSPRQKTLDELAGELDEDFRRECNARAEREPVVVVTHSMGSLLARVWMLRHYAAKGERPPVERVIECSAPRNGVHLAALARLQIRLGLVPGVTLARQMCAPNPFLWDLAWEELTQASLLPPVIGLTGIETSRSLQSWFVGGAESDGVVPAIYAQPNAVFLRPKQEARRLPERPFLIFRGYRHNGPRGLLCHLRSATEAPGQNPVADVLRAAVSQNMLDSQKSEHPSRSLLVVRGPRGAPSPPPVLELATSPAARRLRPAAVHPEGLALFDCPAQSFAAGKAVRFSLHWGGQTWTSEDLGSMGLAQEEVVYVDLQSGEASIETRSRQSFRRCVYSCSC